MTMEFLIPHLLTLVFAVLTELGKTAIHWLGTWRRQQMSLAQKRAEARRQYLEFLRQQLLIFLDQQEEKVLARLKAKEEKHPPFE